MPRLTWQSKELTKSLCQWYVPHIRRNTTSNHANKCTDSFTSYREWAGSPAETLNWRFNSERKPANQMFTVPMNVSAILVKVDLKIQSSAWKLWKEKYVICLFMKIAFSLSDPRLLFIISKFLIIFMIQENGTRKWNHNWLKTKANQYN